VQVRDAPRRPRQRVRMRSGDAVLFDGGIAANVRLRYAHHTRDRHLAVGGAA